MEAQGENCGLDAGVQVFAEEFKSTPFTALLLSRDLAS